MMLHFDSPERLAGWVLALVFAGILGCQIDLYVNHPR